ncbi:hypothetical protein [Paraburkholderia megapolitana]|uniref:Uncharacterized protein n=1 Tax=Paraburkholderia megapolitana TaxID=420953 RepID=A0A1I3USA9_9BURK|nr:hypothetical protein [Paraburkholderia megapolitana]SFJ84691.1 hypothetical protein SAMN05192543_11210 [Paraburkholderia megapolitana]
MLRVDLRADAALAVAIQMIKSADIVPLPLQHQVDEAIFVIREALKTGERDPVG